MNVHEAIRKAVAEWERENVKYDKWRCVENVEMLKITYPTVPSTFVEDVKDMLI